MTTNSEGVPGMNQAGLAGQPRASRLAVGVGRMTLRMGNYPGRGVVGTLGRKESRRRGGQAFYVLSSDGTRLAAWYSPAHRPADAGTAGDGVPRLPIVLSHGWCEFKELHFRHAWRLNALGHDVVLFDHRGHGRSEGRWVTFGVRERYDLLAVADAAAERGYIPSRYITMGFSLGGATVLQHAPLDPRVAGVVSIAPFVHFRAAINSFRTCLAPWMNEAWLMRGFERATRDHGFEIDEATTLEAMEKIEAPVLLVEGGRDRNLPPCDHTRKLIPAKTRGPLEVICVDDACHRTIGHGAWPQVHAAVERFCSSVG